MWKKYRKWQIADLTLLKNIYVCTARRLTKWVEIISVGAFLFSYTNFLRVSILISNYLLVTSCRKSRFLKVKNDPSEETFTHYASSDIKLCVKKNMAVCQNNSNNCSKCRADFMVYRSQTESLIWKFTHFFTTISSWFSLRTGKKAKFHISQWNQTFCEVEYEFLDLRFN